MKTAFLLFFIIVLWSTYARAQQTFNTLSVKDLSTNKVSVTSTTQSSKPCPVMTEVQRNAIASPVSGSCIYNSNTLTLNVYNGTTWKSAGGGINNWITANNYAVDDVVIQSLKIYQCLEAHTSGTFATDLAALKWSEISPYVDTDTIGVNIKAEAGSVNNAVQEIQVPNNSLTNTDTNKQLIETGNSNLLANSSFEHSTFSTSWTLTAGTPTVETTKVIHGAKSYKATLSAQTLNLFQDSTLYASQFAGTVQGVAMVRVNTTVSGIFVCPRQAGVNQLGNCAQVDNSGTWGLYKIPFVLGATSNGIAIVSGTQSNGLVTVGNVTGDVYVDDASVETGSVVDTQPIIGPWIAYTPASSPGFGTITAVSLYYRQNGSNLEIRGAFTTGTVDGNEARLALPAGYTSVSTIPTLQIAGTGGSNGTNENPIPLIEPSKTYLTFGRILASEAILSKRAGNAMISSSKIMSINATVPVAELQGSTNTYTSSCGANCVDTFSAKVSSAGVVSEENADWISGSAPVSDTSLYTFTWNTGIFTVAPNCTYANDDANAGSALIQPSSHTVPTSSGVVVRQINVNTGGKTASPFTISCQKTGADFTASRTIVGSFKGAVTSPMLSKPAFVSFETSSAGVVSQDDSDAVNGNCAVSDTSLYTCTWNTSYWASAPKCYPNITNGSQSFKVDKETIPTTTSGIFRTSNSTTAAKAASGFTVFCHGEKQ